MPLIDNIDRTLYEALKNSLSSADRVDIMTGFFYFSGFKTLAGELKDKKIRILVGLEVESDLIPQIVQNAKAGDEDLTRWQPRQKTTTRTELRRNYIKAFIGFMNDSDIFDDPETLEVFKLYSKKLEDGSLEIRKTIDDQHGKFYLLYNKKEHSEGGDYPGTVFMGSSNFTYRGLSGQGEMNDSSREKEKFLDYKNKFEELWDESRSVSIADKYTREEFLTKVNSSIWPNANPKPFELYLRILHELFYEEDKVDLLTPSNITKGLYLDFEYQLDAIKIGMEKLKKYDGLILADVVGLGKSIIASAIARNLDMRTVIITPPHLIPQWEDYKEHFGVRGSKVFSCGVIQEVFRRYKESKEPILLIIDEAHRFRNEDTIDYKLLHQVSRSNPENKILLLTATPFNNDPKDVFALLKLFQTPGQSTIRSIDNLSLRYRELIIRYKKLRKNIAQGLGQSDIDREAKIIAAEQRRLIESIVLRRSRLDLDHITRYRKDLERQGISFPKIKGPDIIEYKLNELLDLYIDTLDLITRPDDEGFIGARYKPATYFTSEGREKFIEKYKEDIDEKDLNIAQINLAKFMKRLLVMRFESSKFAFKSTLENMIRSNKIIEEWYSQIKKVPIMKKGTLPDPRDYNLEDGEDSNDFEQDIELLREKKGLLEIDADLLEPQFIEHVRHDTEFLEEIYSKWFEDKNLENVDPKIDELKKKTEDFLKLDKSKKIVIFSTYKDTVDYLYQELLQRGRKRIFKYSSADSTVLSKKIIRKNFDASIPENEQEDKYDVLIATDALSEGFNLHRAGIIINYDIPYNPTRVIQRIGRINRINKKVFDEIEIYNCFPTHIGESEVRIKLISTLKIKLINAVVGSDTKTLTKDEQLQTFFKDELRKAEEDSEQLSWDAIHQEIYESNIKDKEVFNKIMGLPHRARIKRLNSKEDAVIVFGKKGDHSIFTYGQSSYESKVISAEEALKYFSAKTDEEGSSVDEEFINIFISTKDKLFAKHELPKIQGRRANAIRNLKAIGKVLPKAKDYCEDVISIIKDLDDLSDGALKDITNIELIDVEDAITKIKEIVPEAYINNIQERVRRNEREEELLLFAEQLKR
jgi:superfamily II DNA or RNA helicase